MIEDAIFLTIGLCAATLVALACIPLIWRRALREARRRLELILPLSTQEIAAQRDAIRAEAAVGRRRLEQKLETSRDASASLMIDLGRRTVSLAESDAANAALRRERATLITEAQVAQRLIVDLEAQRGALNLALCHSDERLGLLEAEHRRVTAERDHVSQALDDAQSLASSLAEQNGALRERIADRQKESESIRAILVDLRLAHSTVTRERDRARKDLASMQAEGARLDREILRLKEPSDADWPAVDEPAREPMPVEAARRPRPALGDAWGEDIPALKRRVAALESRLLAFAQADGASGSAADAAAELRVELAAVGDLAMRVLVPTEITVAERSAALAGPSV